MIYNDLRSQSQETVDAISMLNAKKSKLFTEKILNLILCKPPKNKEEEDAERLQQEKEDEELLTLHFQNENEDVEVEN